MPTEYQKSKKKTNQSLLRGNIFLLMCLTTVVFIALKLFSFIDWNWFWILSPLWGGLALYLVVNIFIEIIRSIVLWRK